MSIAAYAALKKSQPVQPFSYVPKRITARDVRIRVSHCGVCRSDIHLIDNDWGSSHYPLVPGHEIIGTIIEVGSKVKNVKCGQRVGVGWQRSACFTCALCKHGDENMCSASLSTCVDGYGGFADEVQVDSRFSFHIPASLPSEKAAPLLCGGITVYSPLQHFGVGAGKRVGILGVGGLGHLAVQFAAKMGCEVIALSSSLDKEKEAKKLGAQTLVNINDRRKLSKLRDSLDFILSTTNADLDWSTYVDLLRADGKLCFVGVPNKPLTIPIYKLLGDRKSICGSPIGSPRMIKDMLNFAAKHKVTAKTEVVPLSDVNKAIQKVRQNQARYRMVLKV